MIDILLTVLLAVLVIDAFYRVITLLPLPPPFRQVAMIIIALVFLLWLLNLVGFVGSPLRVRLR